MSSTPEIAIIGVGLHPFGRYADRSALEMGAVAISRALRDAGVPWSDVGSLYAGSLEVANPEAVTGPAGMTGIPVRATLSCATGNSLLTLTTALTELGRLRADMVTHGASSTNEERFARLYVTVVAAQARAATTVRALAADQMVGPESSIDKLLVARAEQDINDLIMDVRLEWMIAGVAPTTTSGSGIGTDGEKELDSARAHWWYTRAATIMGGSAEVQRGIIADNLLGLPKEKR